MNLKIQNSSTVGSMKEKIALLAFGVALVTLLSWISQDFIPGYVYALLISFMTAVFIFRMSSDIQMKEKEIREKESRLAEVRIEKMQANLLRSISHDIRTPLANIQGSSELILENNISDEKKRLLLKNIYDDSEWLISMIENLLIVSQIKGDSLSIKTSEELVEEIVSEAVQKVERRYPDKEINVCVPEEYILVPMDACLIEQTLINLMENAIVHSSGCGSVDVSVRDTPHAVVFKVKDYGSGIPEEKLKNLFDGCIYSRTNSPDAYRGLGIGLSICKTIISAHHGTIIGRNHSEGAEFIFTLPKE